MVLPHSRCPTASLQGPPEFRENFLEHFDQEARLSREFDEWVSKGKN
jgi:hypothetical protein